MIFIYTSLLSCTSKLVTYDSRHYLTNLSHKEKYVNACTKSASLIYRLTKFNAQLKRAERSISAVARGNRSRFGSPQPHPIPSVSTVTWTHGFDFLSIEFPAVQEASVQRVASTSRLNGCWRHVEEVLRKQMRGN